MKRYGVREGLKKAARRGHIQAMRDRPRGLGKESRGATGTDEHARRGKRGGLTTFYQERVKTRGNLSWRGPHGQQHLGIRTFTGGASGETSERSVTFGAESRRDKGQGLVAKAHGSICIYGARKPYTSIQGSRTLHREK